jgi:hypothetical protein
MKERLLLGRIAGERSHVISWHAQMSAVVEADFAYAALAFLDETAMAACITLQRVAIEMLSQFHRAFSGEGVEHFG